MRNEIQVLHVDDDPDFAELSAAFLERQDERIAVRVATSAADGSRLLAEHDFDCVVSDYEMPETNGIAFLEFVRETHPDLPFILFTGKGSEEVASKAVSAEVTDYLQKTPGEDCYTLLANRILNAVEHYSASRQLVRTKNLRRELTKFAVDILRTDDIDVDAKIDHALEKIGGLAGADRSYVFQIDRAAGSTNNTHEWCATGVDPEIEQLQDIPLETIPWWMQKLDNGESITVSRVADLPAEADTERAILEEQNVESVVVVPMSADGAVAGFIGFAWIDPQEITDDLADILHMAGQLITTMMGREEREQKLRERTRQLEGVLDNVEAAIWMRDTDSRYILMNHNYRRLFDIDGDASVRGKRPADLLSTGSAAKFRENDQLVIDTKESIELERTIATEGGEKTYLVRLTPLFDDGDLFAICGVASEITPHLDHAP